MNNQSLRKLALFALGSLLWAAPCLGSDSEAVSIKKMEDKVRVEIGGDLFAEYVYKGYAKPIVYPIRGPHGVRMTRDFPMKKTPGEAEDHKHHKSLWYTHGAVNGVDFWGEGSNSGTIVHEKLLEAKADSGRAIIKTSNKWQKPDKSEVCTDTTTLAFLAIPGGRVIDFEITIHASNGDVVFGDTKEGTMGIRTHPNLRLKNDERRGVTTANGHALNSEGDRDKSLWGKRAKWVDYWGTVDEKVVGVAIFDHPSNPRHPTWWHARDYGLVAANPFGIHDFEKKPDGTGDLKIPAGEQRTWKYRFIFHEGELEKAKVAELYEKFAK